MIALCRYVTASCLNSLRWVAPVLVFALGLTLPYAQGGETLATLAEGATWLFPITAWVTVVTLNDEDPSQAANTAVAAGGIGRARTGKLMVALGFGVLMAVVALAVAFATNPSNFTFDDLAAGVVSHALAVISGVAVGSLCARPLFSRTAWAVLVIVAVTVMDLVIPYGPPARVVLIALNRTRLGEQ